MLESVLQHRNVQTLRIEVGAHRQHDSGRGVLAADGPVFERGQEHLALLRVVAQGEQFLEPVNDQQAAPADAPIGQRRGGGFHGLRRTPAFSEAAEFAVSGPRSEPVAP